MKTQDEAARLLGVCERTFRRYLARREADGLDGLIPPHQHRCHFVKAKVQVHRYPDGMLA